MAIMKNWILIIGLLVCSTTFAQQTDTKTIKNEPEFSSDVVQISSDQKTLIFKGNVKLKTDIIEFEDAKEIVYNPTTKKLTASGLKGFKFKGTIKIIDKAQKKIVTYTIGEKIAFLQ